MYEFISKVEVIYLTSLKKKKRKRHTYIHVFINALDHYSIRHKLNLVCYALYIFKKY